MQTLKSISSAFVTSLLMDLQNDEYDSVQLDKS